VRWGGGRGRQQKREGERINDQCKLIYIAMNGHMYGHTKDLSRRHMTGWTSKRHFPSLVVLYTHITVRNLLVKI
jgi:hypothetical protein